MSDKSRRDHVIEKYRLTEEADVEMVVDGKPLGRGPIMAINTFAQFLNGDPSGNQKYLDWMMFMAGGGQEVMARTLALWKGQKPDDPESLRNQTKADYVAEWMAGYVDEAEGLKHPPLSQREAEQRWAQYEPRSLFEFVMGDQDIAANDGYGFYRYWPGKNGLYAKIVNVIKIWHDSQPRLKAINLAQIKGDPKAKLIELDLYKGWSPNDYSQDKAHYKTLDSLLTALSGMRLNQVLSTVQADTIYSDDALVAICPLTIGASVKFGCAKWCTANRTDFERTFDLSAARSHWYNYCSRGPLVYFNWKCSMPEPLEKLALHVESSRLESFGVPWDMVNFYDTKNDPGGTHYFDICEKMRARSVSRRQANLDKALLAVQSWAKTFDCRRIVLNYAAELEVSSV